MDTSRRGFLSKAALTGTVIFAGNAALSMNAKNLFVHHVYFWLKNPDSKEDRDKLVDGLRKLSKATTIKDFHIGQPASTNREVIDRSYSVSWLLFFENQKDQDIYQTDPIHLKFVEECSGLWKKVVVYDSIDL